MIQAVACTTTTDFTSNPLCLTAGFGHQMLTITSMVVNRHFCYMLTLVNVTRGFWEAVWSLSNQ